MQRGGGTGSGAADQDARREDEACVGRLEYPFECSASLT